MALNTAMNAAGSVPDDKEAVIQDILREVVPGDAEQDVRVRQSILDEVSGLSLQTISKLPQTFWSTAANDALVISGTSSDEEKARITRLRLVLASSGEALTAQVLCYVSTAAEKVKREIQLAKLPEADVSGLVTKISNRLQVKFTPALIPPSNVVAKCKANKFVELAECRVSDAEYSSTRSELATSVTGANVEILKKPSDSSKFLLSGEVTVCLLRLMMALWLVAPEQGNFLVFLNYVLRVTEMGNHGWGRALRLDRRHRESVITRMAADKSLTIYDMFEDDVVTANFAKATLEYETSNGKDKKKGCVGEGFPTAQEMEKVQFLKPAGAAAKTDKSSKFKPDEEKRK
ncbi:hypothetical protein Pmar_PMAR029362 [Perkinsus marinus ATCC 50983]|uniref:Uncharacterized protein n=1 Tax=Perkinsus marinus (strain ATCC 50983 / TXsc) TaxID=423536 RepID=C5KMX9_PERM5|nr:hypothetical protein Pmar_PMAR029362 [Perkinsus marinus ATCC 50983]EER14287.1 hypothetical protein Pmar_PMAR029362 [Perkinsus marinus ATCC 50983]|eukprot:XP_002782492.1 hypothetical protein Pmar_PMAR029362 [Perkinsus marinus ATCC 50983]